MIRNLSFALILLTVLLPSIVRSFPRTSSTRLLRAVDERAAEGQGVSHPTLAIGLDNRRYCLATFLPKISVVHRTVRNMSSEEEYEPKLKKAKKSKKSKDVDEEEEDEEEEDAEDEQEEDDKKSGKVQRNEVGEAYFELPKNKRCTVRKWKNMIFVDIREVGFLMQ